MTKIYWLAESQIKSHKGNFKGTLIMTTTRVWAVGTGDKELAWFLNRQDALDFQAYKSVMRDDP